MKNQLYALNKHNCKNCIVSQELCSYGKSFIPTRIHCKIKQTSVIRLNMFMTAFIESRSKLNNATGYDIEFITKTLFQLLALVKSKANLFNPEHYPYRELAVNLVSMLNRMDSYEAGKYGAIHQLVIGQFNDAPRYEFYESFENDLEDDSIAHKYFKIKDLANGETYVFKFEDIDPVFTTDALLMFNHALKPLSTYDVQDLGYYISEGDIYRKQQKIKKLSSHL